jgi:hypothetical protein
MRAILLLPTSFPPPRRHNRACSGQIERCRDPQSFPSSPPLHDAATVLASPSPPLPCLLARNPIPAPNAAVLLALARSGTEEPTVPRHPLHGSLKGITPISEREKTHSYIFSQSIRCCLETSCNEAGKRSHGVLPCPSPRFGRGQQPWRLVHSSSHHGSLGLGRPR